MKYIKFYETNKEPEEGDYIIGRLHNNNAATAFCHNNIGQIIGIIYGRIHNKPELNIYKVRYENVPAGLKISHLNNNIRGFLKKDIELWSKDKEDLEAMIQAKRYNL